jgi:hypothetical protein
MRRNKGLIFFSFLPLEVLAGCATVPHVIVEAPERGAEITLATTFHEPAVYTRIGITIAGNDFEELDKHLVDLDALIEDAVRTRVKAEEYLSYLGRIELPEEMRIILRPWLPGEPIGDPHPYFKVAEWARSEVPGDLLVLIYPSRVMDVLYNTNQQIIRHGLLQRNGALFTLSRTGVHPYIAYRVAVIDVREGEVLARTWRLGTREIGELPWSAGLDALTEQHVEDWRDAYREIAACEIPWDLLRVGVLQPTLSRDARMARRNQEPDWCS